MGTTNNETLTERDEPRFEPWLGVMCAAFIPILLLLVLPNVLSPYLFTLTGILFVTGLVMLLTQQRGAPPGRARPATEGQDVT